MAHPNLQAAVADLDRTGQLLRVRTELDPDLEIAEVHRRIFAAQGPALLFERVKGSPFRALSNLYGTFARTEWLFRDTLERVQRIVELKIDPARFAKAPLRYARAPLTAYTSLPKRSLTRAPILHGRTSVSELPQIKSWPMDGGAFVTMPQVITTPPGARSAMETNIGMYRVQLSGNDYVPDAEIGLHYQLHRGIGVHHRQYLESDEPFRCSVAVGGAPSYAVAAIMPLPEGLSELTFAGMLSGHSVRYAWSDLGHFLPAEADFVIAGTVRKDRLMPEGPFGDHLGYYSLEHDFPVMEVDTVYHRKDAIWHFSVVGRPPMEDSSFGFLISQIVRDLTPTEFPGVRQVNAVDAAGVHPLLLAVGSERYMPFRPDERDNTRPPEEILTQANRLLGSGQTSLAKFLVIADGGRDPGLDCHDEAAFLRHVLERVDWRRDLHFYTNWTIDTLDYSGGDWNSGSKVVWAARGARRRSLGTEVPEVRWGGLSPKQVTVPLPGVLALSVSAFAGEQSRLAAKRAVEELDAELAEKFPLLLLVDDADFVAASLNNFLWVAFTRCNPASDLYGVGAFTRDKHWGCTGSLVMDARVKPHHAPGLEEDPAVSRRVDKLFAKGGELYGVLPKGFAVTPLKREARPSEILR